MRLSRRTVFVDTETALMLPGLQAPPLACLTWAERRGAEWVSGIVDRHDARDVLRGWLSDPTVVIGGHHIAYDMVVMANDDPTLLPLMFWAYENNRVVCTVLRERLIDLSIGMMSLRPRGYYGLGNLMGLEKEEWRTGYGLLIPIPLADWPEGAKKYAIDDAVGAGDLFYRQRGGAHIVDEHAQARAGFALQLMQTWGMRTDPIAVDKMDKRLGAVYANLKEELQGSGIVRRDGTQNMLLTRELIEASYPTDAIPKTKKGAVSTSSEVIERCSHPALQNLSQFKEVQKTLTTFIPVVKRGIREPVCPSTNTLVKNGRTSYRDPNLQNLPRDGGIRACFVPRPGKVFADVDYDTLEIRTLAQVLKTQGHGSTLVQMYQADPDFDPHCRLAASILGISYAKAIELKKLRDRVLKDTRQMSKAGNFGYPGGMGWKTFVDYAWKNYGVRLDGEKAKWLKEQWFSSIPEMPKYFAQCAAMTEHDLGDMEQIFSGRQRGGCYFTDLANGFWSGLAADGVKHALFQIVKACYVLEESPLFGARPVVVVHDEFILEADIERGHEVGTELARIAMEAMQVYTPDVPSRASPQLMHRWYKDAEPVYDLAGRLIPWEPKRLGT